MQWLGNPRFRYRYLPRILVVVGIAAVVGGAAFAATNLFSNKNSMVAVDDIAAEDAKLPEITIPVSQDPPTVKLDKRIPKVAARFIETAVTRDDLATGWKLAGDCLAGVPCMKAGFTRKMWMTGNIPVVPYPAYGGVKYKVTYSHPDDALLEIAVYPRKGSSLKPGVFHIQLHKYPGKQPWKVVQWSPRANSLVQSNIG